MTVEFADLGTWAGATLVAEYDPEGDVVRVDRKAVARIRAALGPAEGERFVACALAHERFHRDHPQATEADALAFAARVTGADAARYAAVLRHAKP